VLLPEVANIDDTERPAKELLRVLKTPFELLEGTVEISGSIGIAVYPHDADNADRLIAAADAALYTAKRSGRNRYEFVSAPR
jgi:diguanylate cyclase (GGDEF)-like protein